MMKVPAAATIRKNVSRYAAMVGLRIDRNSDGSYNIHDTVIGYDAFTNVTMNWVVRTIYDSLAMQNAMASRPL